MTLTPQGHTYPTKSAWQHDRKLRNRENLQELFPFFLSTRQPALLGSSRIVAGSQTTALAAIPFVAAEHIAWRSQKQPLNKNQRADLCQGFWETCHRLRHNRDN
jgi:hypothetical protein